MPIRVLAAVLICSTACGDSGDTPADLEVLPSKCDAGQLEPGDHTLSLMFAGVERQFIVHVPSRTDTAEPRPLMLNMHGYTSDMSRQQDYTGGGAVESAGYFVAYPNGLGGSWNGGDCCGDSATMDRDDTGFLVAVVESLSEQLCVDRRRVYATGMSNGGFMSHRLACEAADVFAAIAPVSGVLGIAPEDCEPTRPVAVLHFHGRADTIVPFDGGGTVGVNPFRSVDESHAAWAALNGCEGEPEVTFDGPETRCETHAACDGGVEVTLCSSDGAQHCWPGITPCVLGPAAMDIDAGERMLEFFERHVLP